MFRKGKKFSPIFYRCLPLSDQCYFPPAEQSCAVRLEGLSYYFKVFRTLVPIPLIKAK